MYQKGEKPTYLIWRFIQEEIRSTKTSCFAVHAICCSVRGGPTVEKYVENWSNRAILHSVVESSSNGTQKWWYLKILSGLYRKLNKITKTDMFSLPHVDLASGYRQIRVVAGFQEKTAIIIPHGLFQFWVIPFGPTNALTAFQRLWTGLSSH